jgi:hypothetical protein
VCRRQNVDFRATSWRQVRVAPLRGCRIRDLDHESHGSHPATARSTRPRILSSSRSLSAGSRGA